LLIVGFSPETNIGDRARHDGLLKLLRRRGFSGSLPINTRIGANQMARVPLDYPVLSRVADVEIVPSPLPTFDNDGTGFRRIAGEAANAASMVAGLVLLALARFVPGASVALWPRRYRRVLDLIREAEFILWRGTNLRGRRNALIEFYRMYARLFLPLLCAAYGRRVAYVSGSVWSDFAFPARWLVRRVLRGCSHISVRESESLWNARDLIGDDDGPRIEQVPDLSLAILDGSEFAYTSDLRSNGIEIAVTLMDWSGFGREARRRYIEAVARFLEERIESQGARVTIVPQVIKKWESASRIAEEVLATIAPTARESVRTIDGALSIDELVSRYRGSDLLLATRMHSAIFALSAGTPVIAIPYDVGAKWQILGDLGAGELVIGYDRVTVDELRARFALLVDRGESLMEGVRAKLQEQYARVDRNLPAEMDDLFRPADATPPRTPSPS